MAGQGKHITVTFHPAFRGDLDSASKRRLAAGTLRRLRAKEHCRPGSRLLIFETPKCPRNHDER